MILVVSSRNIDLFIYLSESWLERRIKNCPLRLGVDHFSNLLLATIQTREPYLMNFTKPLETKRGQLFHQPSVGVRPDLQVDRVMNLLLGVTPDPSYRLTISPTDRRNTTSQLEVNYITKLLYTRRTQFRSLTFPESIFRILDFKPEVYSASNLI